MIYEKSKTREIHKKKSIYRDGNKILSLALARVGKSDKTAQSNAFDESERASARGIVVRWKFSVGNQISPEAFLIVEHSARGGGDARRERERERQIGTCAN